MASPQMILQLSKDFLRRNNPVEATVKSVVEAVNNVLTFNSKMKLLKYKFMLAQQQLQRMESNLNQGSPYDIRGNKIDQAY